MALFYILIELICKRGLSSEFRIKSRRYNENVHTDRSLNEHVKLVHNNRMQRSNLVLDVKILITITEDCELLVNCR